MEAVRDHAELLAIRYRAQFGSEISTDNAREIVSPEYAASKENRTRFSAATQKPAGMLSDYLFEQALRNPDLDRRLIVSMTAGGTGAGKTTAIHANGDLCQSQFVFDSNFGSKRSSVQKIELAKAAGYQVHVIFVHREPLDALIRGVLPRAMSEGRVVDIDAHARMYRDAAENFGYLVRKYAHDPVVAFTAIDNTGFGRTPMPMPIEKATGIRYSTRELLPKLAEALDKEYAARRISTAVYRASLGATVAPVAGGRPVH